MSDRCCNCQRSTSRRRAGLLGVLFNVALLYVALVFGGGTLQKVDHPVAQELGRLMHTVSFVEPTIDWAQSNRHPRLASSLNLLAGGFPLS